jgi:hypothetical protein
MDLVPDKIRGRLRETQLVILRDRIGSLKTNQNTLRIILGIQVAIYPVLASYLMIFVPMWTLEAIAAFLILTGIFSILAMIAISDSIHMYTKFEEYHELWDDEVQGRAYPGDNPGEKSEESFRHALEADDVGNYATRTAFLFILAIILVIPISAILKFLDPPFNWVVPLGGSLSLPVFMSLLLYKSYHSHVTWTKALRRFLLPKKVFGNEGVVVDEQLAGWGKVHEGELQKKFSDVTIVGSVEGPPKGIKDEDLAEYCRRKHWSLLTCDRTSYIEFLGQSKRSLRVSRFGTNEQSSQPIYFLQMSA